MLYTIVPPEELVLDKGELVAYMRREHSDWVSVRGEAADGTEYTHSFGKGVTDTTIKRSWREDKWRVI